MDLKRIKNLLEKYYSSNTTLEEEAILRKYFNSNNVDNELIADKDIFLYQTSEVQESNKIPDISGQIWETLKDIEDDKAQNKRGIKYLYLRIAASIIILTGSYFLLKNEVFNKQQEIQFTDTYDNPEIAYEQAKEALLYVSAMLNNGASHLEPIQEMNKGTQELYKISSFNDGLRELSPVSTYKLADKYIKQ